MSSPISKLFGGGQGGQQSPIMLLQASTPQPLPPTQTPAQTPTGSPTGLPQSNRLGGSFLASAAPAAATGQTANKTLLGQ